MSLGMCLCVGERLREQGRLGWCSNWGGGVLGAHLDHPGVRQVEGALQGRGRSKGDDRDVAPWPQGLSTRRNRTDVYNNAHNKMCTTRRKQQPHKKNVYNNAQIKGHTDVHNRELLACELHERAQVPVCTSRMQEGGDIKGGLLERTRHTEFAAGLKPEWVNYT